MDLSGCRVEDPTVYGGSESSSTVVDGVMVARRPSLTAAAAHPPDPAVCRRTGTIDSQYESMSTASSSGRTASDDVTDDVSDDDVTRFVESHV